MTIKSNQWLHLIVLAVSVLTLSGCMGGNLKRGDPEYAMVMPQPAPPPEMNNGAIYQTGYVSPLFEDNKARRVGDILTVLLQEATNASKSASTKTAKDSSATIAEPTIFSKTFPLNSDWGSYGLEGSLSGKRENDGSGTSTQSNKLSGSVTVTVAQVLANGNLVVQGEKWVQLNQGKEYVRLRGVVRPSDVTPTNTVLSTQVADAQISYGGTGAIADANAAGWLARFFLSAIFPF